MTKNFVDPDTLAARKSVILTPDLLNPSRRELMAKSALLGMGAVGAALLGACRSGDGTSLPTNPTPTPTPALNDFDILNFALNLEYLEAEFYLRAVTGNGLASNMTTGSGTQGTVTGGRAVTFTTTLARQYAKEIAHDESTHVNFLRTAITAAGGTPVARPNINISDSFAALFNVAGLGSGFDPYASENNFLLAAFVFEDVGVTAYKGAAKLVANKTYLEAAAGILAAEAYHAGLIRTVLYARGYDTTITAANGGDASLINKVQKLSDARDSVDGTTTTATAATFMVGATVGDDDQGITVSGTAPSDMSNIVPTDANGIAYSRNADKVLNVVYLTPNAATSGGFFPNGVNGRINASTAASS